MALEQLYDLAFQYKKTKLWERIRESQIFAVKLSDGRTGYISVMAPNGEYHAMNLYIGEEGLKTLRALLKLDEVMIFDLEYQECIMGLDCLQCSFEKKDGISPEEREAVKIYTRSHGIRLGGKYTYPRFSKLQPYCIPWYLQPQEEDCLCQGLAAAVEMARLLDETGPNALCLEDFYSETKEIPMLEQTNGKFILQMTDVPEEEPETWPEPTRYNDIALAALKKMKKKGVWQCEIIRMPTPIEDNPEEAPAFPVYLLVAEVGSECILPLTTPVIHYEDHPEELFDQMLDAFVKLGICPKKLEVRDERTYTFAKAFSDKLGVPVTIKDTMPDLDDAKFDFLDNVCTGENVTMGGIMKVLDKLRDLDDEDLPQEIAEGVKMLEMLEEQGLMEDFLSSAFPEMELKDTGRKTSKKKTSKKRINKKKAANESYVISVSLGRGCYRHIRISGKSTLWQLHCAILDAFEFDDDHAHAFFMDNKMWSNMDSYYAEMAADGGERTTGKCQLNQAGLYKGMPFKYVFDFGDEWTFQCKVLRVEEGDSGVPVIVKSKGDAPSQYGYWDDEWEDE